MNRRWGLQRTMAFLLIPLVTMTPGCYAAPKTDNPLAVHKKILRLGVGHWVWVDEANGLRLVGRITGIANQSFGMQLNNYPAITDVRYADVVRVRGADLTSKKAIALFAATAGVAVALGFLIHLEFRRNQARLPQPSVSGLPQP